jgi:membrane-associated PAP2 superfamily phosphatase
VRYLKAYVFPLMLLLLILVLEIFDLDNRVMSLVFDASSQSFPLRHHWLTEGVIHTNGRRLITVFGGAIIIALIGSLYLPSLRSVRRQWIFITVSIAVSTVFVLTLKTTTGVYCAYDLLPYGGELPANQLANLWQGGGACWPGGHVSGPLGLIAIYFAFRDQRHGLAVVVLVTALLLGTIFGVGQTLRGAHFPSHTLWTLLFVWVLNTILANLLLSHSPQSKSTPGATL